MPIGIDDRDDVIPFWGLLLLFHSPIGLDNKTAVRPTYGPIPETSDTELIGHQGILIIYNDNSIKWYEQNNS